MDSENHRPAYVYKEAILRPIELQVDFYSPERDSDLDSCGCESDAPAGLDPEGEECPCAGSASTSETSGSDSGIHAWEQTEVHADDRSDGDCHQPVDQWIENKLLDIYVNACDNCNAEVSTYKRRHQVNKSNHQLEISICTSMEDQGQGNRRSLSQGHVNGAYIGDGNASDSSDSSVFFEETWEEVTTVRVDLDQHQRSPIESISSNSKRGEDGDGKCGLVSVICNCFNPNAVQHIDKADIRPVESAKYGRTNIEDFASEFCRGCRTRIFPHLKNGLRAVKGRFQEDNDDVVIASALRTPICLARKGALKDTLPDDLLAAVLSATMTSLNIDPTLIEDVCVGNALQPGAGITTSRIAQFFSDMPDSCSLSSVNRLCSSGLQACANIAASIKAGFIDIGIAAGVESMSTNPINTLPSGLVFNPKLMEHDEARQLLTGSGIVSDNMADKFGFSREQLDRVASESITKAANAQKEGVFEEEIIPIETFIVGHDSSQKNITVSSDDVIRNMSREDLSRLKPSHKQSGVTTTGNSAAPADGAAAILMARRSTAARLGLPVLGVFRGFASTGVPPEYSGVGSAFAATKVLEKTGLTVDDVDVFELSESSAAEVCFCAEKLSINMSKINPRGGGIGLGHPIGCTGARHLTTLIHELKRRGKRANGMAAMSVGNGMGAAAIIEAPG